MSSYFPFYFILLTREVYTNLIIEMVAKCNLLIEKSWSLLENVNYLNALALYCLYFVLLNLIWYVLIHANIDICLPYSNISVVISFTFTVLFGFVYFQTQLQKQDPKRERKRAADKKNITHRRVVWSLRRWSQWPSGFTQAEELG